MLRRVWTYLIDTSSLSFLLLTSSCIGHIEHRVFCECHNIIVLATWWVHHAISANLWLGSWNTIIIDTLCLLTSTTAERHLIIHKCILLSWHHSTHSWNYALFTSLSVKVYSPVLSTGFFLWTLLILPCFWWEFVITIRLHRIHILFILDVLSTSCIYSLIIILIITAISIIIVVVMIIIIWPTKTCSWIHCKICNYIVIPFLLHFWVQFLESCILLLLLRHFVYVL